jgi:hypothetical protein
VEIVRRYCWPLMVGDDRCGFLRAGRSLMLRSASGVVGLARCVEVNHGLSMTFDALHETSATKLAWLLRA